MPYILVAGAACALASLFFVSSLDMPLAAAQMPRILVGLLFILAGAMLVDVFRHRKASRQRPADAKLSPEEAAAMPLIAPFFEGVNIPRALTFLGAVILYVVLLEPLGYFIVTPLFLLGTLLFLKACRLLVAAAIAAVAPIFVYFIFITLLDLPIPMGVMG